MPTVTNWQGYYVVGLIVALIMFISFITTVKDLMYRPRGLSCL